MTSSFLEKENLILSPSHEGSAPQKMIVSWHDFEQAVVALALNIYNSGLQFDHIVCIARGGMFLGDILSRLFQVPLAVISASSYREEGGNSPRKPRHFRFNSNGNEPARFACAAG